MDTRPHPAESRVPAGQATNPDPPRAHQLRNPGFVVRSNSRVKGEASGGCIGYELRASSRRSTRFTARSRSSCSQIRRTSQPPRERLWATNGGIHKDDNIMLRCCLRVLDVELIVRIDCHAFELTLFQGFGKGRPQAVIETTWIAVPDHEKADALTLARHATVLPIQHRPSRGGLVGDPHGRRAPRQGAFDPAHESHS